MISRRGLLAFIGFGAVAQWIEHLPSKQTVLGSIPSGTSTTRPPMPEWIVPPEKWSPKMREAVAEMSIDQIAGEYEYHAHRLIERIKQ